MGSATAILIGVTMGSVSWEMVSSGGRSRTICRVGTDGLSHLLLQMFDEGSEDSVLDVVMASQVDLYGEDVLEY